MNVSLIERQTIQFNQPLRVALDKLNNVPDNLTLFVLNELNQLTGALTDGDIRRGLLKGLSVDDTVEHFMFRDFKYLLNNEFTLDQIRELKKKRIKLVPLVDDGMRIIRLIDLVKYKSVLPLDVLIMAGGKGERLRPLTEHLPKPLLKVGDSPILEHNLRHIAKYGIQKINLSVNYLGHMIEDYFGNGNQMDLELSYIHEDQALGTIGSASLIKDISHDQLLVMNADVLTNIDLEDFFSDYKEQQAMMAVASVPYKVSMPFAVLETSDNRVLSFSEKPEYTYYTNAGIYLINKNLLSRIPKNSVYHATDLMQNVLDNKEKLVQYSIHGLWMDIGRKEDYERAQHEIKHLYTK